MRRLFYNLDSKQIEENIFGQLKDKFQTNPSYKVLYLTPTMFLMQRRRAAFLNTTRKLANRGVDSDFLSHFSESVQIYEFDEWTKTAVYSETKLNPLSRAESHIMIKRILSETYPSRADWKSTSSSLLDVFNEFDTLEDARSVISQLSLYEDWKEISGVYEEYLKKIEESHMMTFGQCLRFIIEQTDELDAYDEIIFDGPFLFFSPVQEMLMKKFDGTHRVVTFIIPFSKDRQETQPAFKIIETVYSRYVPSEKWRLMGYAGTMDSFDLKQLQAALFTDRTIENRGSLSIHSHLSIDQEIRRVVRKAKTLIESGASTARKIIIVTSDAMSLRPLVREIAEQEKLNVSIPSKPFLGLAEGEFLNLVYKIKVDERKFDEGSYIDRSMFKRILNSGWFPTGRATLKEFEFIEAVFFNHLTTIEEWKAQFVRLQQIKLNPILKGMPYHPVNGIEVEHITTWIDILNELEELQNRLEHFDSHNIEQQVRNLYHSLLDLAARTGFQNTEVGTSFFKRLNKFVENTGRHSRIPMKFEEFGESIGRIFVEDSEEGIRGSDQQIEKDKLEILVTGPENVAFLEYNYLFLVRFSQNHMPALSRSKWPMHSDLMYRYLSLTTALQLNSASEYEEILAQREQYYFNLLFQVANAHMEVSFSRTEQGEKSYPSHYLFDLARAYGIDSIDEDELLSKLEASKLATSYLDSLEKKELIPLEKTIESQQFVLPNLLKLNEVAVYKLCPKRFHYSQVAPKTNVYKSRFQVGRYFSVVLAQKVLEKLFESLSAHPITEQIGQSTQQHKRLMERIPHFLYEELEVWKPLYPLDPEVLNNSRYYAKFLIENVIKRATDQTFAKKILGYGRSQFKVEFQLSVQNVALDIPIKDKSYTISYTQKLMSKLEGKFYFHPVEHYSDFIGISSYISKENNSQSFGEWFHAIRKEFFSSHPKFNVTTELTSLLESIENSHFEKKPGEHCLYCPYESICHKADLHLEKPSLLKEQISNVND